MLIGIFPDERFPQRDPAQRSPGGEGMKARHRLEPDTAAQRLGSVNPSRLRGAPVELLGRGSLVGAHSAHGRSLMKGEG